MKKLEDNLGLPVERIDVCSRGFMLYWKNDENAESCKFCSQLRYKINRRQVVIRDEHGFRVEPGTRELDPVDPVRFQVP